MNRPAATKDDGTMRPDAKPPLSPEVPADGLPELIPFYAGDKPCPTHLYVLEELVIELGDHVMHKSKLLDEQDNTLAKTWELIFRGFELTGSPSVVVNLWRVSSDVSLMATQISLREEERREERRGYREFRAHVLQQTQHLLAPMPYDPGLVPGAIRSGIMDAGGDETLLIDRITIQPRAMRRFTSLKENVFIPTVTRRDDDDRDGRGVSRERFGWTLLASGSALTGRVGTVFNCWRLPSSNRLLRSMAALTEITEYRALPPLIQAEAQDLYALHRHRSTTNPQ
jgi:hypothetical protein